MKCITLFVGLLFSFLQSMQAQPVVDTICILQLNDVYEIGPLQQGKYGGMARVATVIKQSEKRYQTFVVMAGDFLSPSVIGTVKIDGNRIFGQQMVDMMNKAGVDLATFGNHEFDIPEKDLQQRMNESEFAWTSANTFHRLSDGTKQPFYKVSADSVAVVPSYLLKSANNQFTIAIIAATIATTRTPFVAYETTIPSLKKAFRQAKRNADVVIGLTHLTLAEDKQILRKLKKIPLIMGGHEHENNYVSIGKRAVAKADANARSMYRHLLYRDGKNGKINIKSDLIPLDSSIVPDRIVANEVKVWEDKAYAAFRSVGLEPEAVVYQTKEPLDGREINMRQRQTNLGNTITAAMLAISPGADAAVFNSGSVRIDDVIDGVVTQLDIIRILPFGGNLCEVVLTGKLFNQLLTTANELKGQGGYLQTSKNLVYDGKKWLLDGGIMDDQKSFKIIVPGFLVSGNEKGLDFFKEGNAGIKTLTKYIDPTDVRSDVRLVVVKYLSSL